jgi:cytochrome c oxidase subunit IV
MENRDDLTVNDSYAPLVNHSEEEGKVIRKKIWKVTAILSILTAIEILMGIYLSSRDAGYWPVIKWLFIIMTVIKAFYIVWEFMHLGHEKKSLRRYIVIPYVFFILYMIALIILEGFKVGSASY